jgi:hypothetical protein
MGFCLAPGTYDIFLNLFKARRIPRNEQNQCADPGEPFADCLPNTVPGASHNCDLPIQFWH